MKKNSIYYLVLLCLSIALFSCKGDDGAVGPTGAPGPAGADGGVGPAGPAGADGGPQKVLYETSIISGTVTGLMADDTEFSEDFEYGVAWDLPGFSTSGANSNFSHYVYQDVPGISYASLSFRIVNKGEEDEEGMITGFYLNSYFPRPNNKVFRCQVSFNTYEITEFSYDPATGNLSFDYEVNGTMQGTGKAVKAVGKVNMVVYDDILFSSEKEVVSENQIK